MTVSEEISVLRKQQYNDFNGNLMQKLGRLHDTIREDLGDEKYLEYLRLATKNNSRPIYQPRQTIHQ